MYHVPVMVKEVITCLNVKAGGIYIDCTLGGGGHTRAILTALGPSGRLIALDRDVEALDNASGLAIDARVTLVQSVFDRLAPVLEELGVAAADGILFDLGVSSHQLDDPGRGFTYQVEAPLDMRMDKSEGKTAADFLRELDEKELAEILWKFGEERYARKIAAMIVRERQKRPLTTTLELAELVRRAIPAAARRGGKHPARRTFQALRIAVNDELKKISLALEEAVPLLRPEGRIVVLSYHSLEDRLVKSFFREMACPCVCPPDLPVCRCGKKPVLKPVTRRPVIPDREEIEANPRARSAKLRAAEKL